MKDRTHAMKRREFIKRGTAVAGGISLWPAAMIGRPFSRSENSTAEDRFRILTRTLGRTGIEIPVVSLGAPGDGGVMRAALAAGIKFFDTAYRYAGGASETLIGENVKGRPRDSFIVATKVLGLRDNETGLIPQNVTTEEFKADFRNKVETSLKRLQVEYLDILFLHGVETAELLRLSPVREVLQELKSEGKTRFIGASFHHKELELIPAVVREKIYDVILTSYNFRQPHRQEVRQAIAAAGDAGLGILAMKTSSGVYWDRERKYPINAKASLKWVLQEKHVHSAVRAVDNFDQLAQTVSVLADLHLTPDEEDDLHLGKKLGLAGLYCSQCGRCRQDCRFHLDIPTAMRAYMYAYGYGRPRQAQETLGETGAEAVSCRACTSCRVSCAMGFNVPEKMRDIVRILDVPGKFIV